MNYKLRPLEEYSTPQKNLFVWISDYYAWKFLAAKIDKDKQKDDFDLSLLVNNMLKASTDTMEKVIDVVKEASSQGITGVKNSYTTLEAFYNHVEKENDIESIKEIDQQYIENFILSVNHAESNATKERYYTHLKALFNFIQDHNTTNGMVKPYIFNIGKDKDGKAKKILHTRKAKRLPVFLEYDEMVALNKSIVKYPYYTDEFDKAKQVLIIRLFLFGLIGTTELIKLEDKDFIEIEDDKSIFELNVGDRIVNLPRAKFIKYLNTYRELNLCSESKSFFCSIRNQSPINNQYISKIIKAHFEYAKIKKPKATAEVLRNSGILHLRRGRWSDIKIKEMIGAKEVRTVQDFLKSVNTDHYTVANMFDEFTD